MKASAKSARKRRLAPRQQRVAPAQRPRPAQPTAAPSRTRLISAAAAAGTLVAAAPLWPSPSSRMTWAGAPFLAAVGLVAFFVGRTAATAYGFDDIAARWRSSALLVLVVLVPAFLDLRITNSYNLAKFTVTLIGALAISTIWVAEAVRPGSRPQWRNGLHWPVLALLGWTAITTATSVSPRMSILGAMGSNDGLVAAAAFAVIFFAVAQGVSVDHVRSVLSVLYFGAGGLVVLYGLIQLHDRLFSGPSWDWLHIVGRGSSRFFAEGGIFATFGNPNHFAGFLAVLVPVGFVLLVVHRTRWVRVLTLAILAGLLVELLQTASRGALLATLVALGVAGALTWPDMRRRPSVPLAVLGVVVASVVLGSLLLAGVPRFSAKLSSALKPGATLSVRIDIWKTGVAMANGRPLVGHGPDTWTDRVSRYRDAELAERYGSTGVLSNGAHNIFVSQLAATGYPGLILLLTLLGFATIRAVRTWAGLRQIEAASRDDEASNARVARLLLVAVVGALAAYVVQACFNVSQIGVSFLFWVLLGLICALSVVAGVPMTVRVRALVGRPLAPARWRPQVESRPPVRRPGEGRSDDSADLAGRAIAVLACIGLVFAVAVATRPHRAAHNDWAAKMDSASALRAPPDKAQLLSRRAAMRRANAVELNPWEPLYLVQVADDYLKHALSLSERSTQMTALHRAREHYERAIELRPHTVPYLERYADVLLKIHDINPADADARAGAIRALRRAVNADPVATRARERLQLLVGS